MRRELESLAIWTCVFRVGLDTRTGEVFSFLPWKEDSSLG
jgi:hypothetical protein